MGQKMPSGFARIRKFFLHVVKKIGTFASKRPLNKLFRKHLPRNQTLFMPFKIT